MQSTKTAFLVVSCFKLCSINHLVWLGFNGQVATVWVVDRLLCESCPAVRKNTTRTPTVRTKTGCGLNYVGRKMCAVCVLRSSRPTCCISDSWVSDSRSGSLAALVSSAAGVKGQGGSCWQPGWVFIGKEKICETKERHVCRWSCVWLEMFSPSNTSEKTNLNFNECCLFFYFIAFSFLVKLSFIDIFD